MQLKDEVERTLTGVAITGLAGFAFGAARGIIQQRYGGWLQWISMMVAAGTVAILTGLAVSATDLSPNQRYAVIGICAFLAEDIVLGFIMMASLFRTDPFGAAKKLWDALRGRT